MMLHIKKNESWWTMQFNGFFLIILLSLCGCMTAPKVFMAQNVQIDLTDGVDATEAQALAKAYFYQNISDYGTVGKPIDKVNYWEVEARIGYAEMKMDGPITIDKKTGKVNYDGWENHNRKD